MAVVFSVYYLNNIIRLLTLTFILFSPPDPIFWADFYFIYFLPDPKYLYLKKSVNQVIK